MSELSEQEVADFRLAWCNGSGSVIATAERILAARTADLSARVAGIHPDPSKKVGQC